MSYIKATDCVNGSLYRIRSRNLTLGVFRSENNGFVGIREKYGIKYLFTEYHYDNGVPFGTVIPTEILEACPLADLQESLGFLDSVTNRPVSFVSIGYGWSYSDTGERSADIIAQPLPNQKLLDWLTDKEAQYGVKEPS